MSATGIMSVMTVIGLFIAEGDSDEKGHVSGQVVFSPVSMVEDESKAPATSSLALTSVINHRSIV